MKNILKKKLIFIFTVLLFFISGLICFILYKNSYKSEVTINVYNWGEYISDGSDGNLNVNEEFTKRTGIRVNYSTFQSNEALFAKIQNGGTKYDVIIPSDYMVSKMIEQNMLQKLNFEQIPNFSYINSSFRNPEYDPYNEYSIPYTWGTVGIFYNKKMVSESEEQINWNILWNKKYSGKILMFDNPRDAFAISQIRLGIPLNSKNKQDWIRASEDLKAQKPLVQAYVMDQIFDKMGNGEAALAPYYTGDAAILTQRNSDIGFVIPKEGSNKFVDAMCIPKSSEHPNEAMAYINFMCDPEIAVENIKYIGYSSPESEVKNRLDPKISNNKICYPDNETLKNTQVFTSLPDEITSLIDTLWINIKTGEHGNPFGLIIVLIGFILVYLAIIFIKKRKLKD